MVEYDFVKVPIVDIVNQIILYAAQHRASDIHFDPLEDALMVRMRVDGDLQNHALVPKLYERNLITRIKLVSAMNITETRLPQDGAIKGRIGGRDLDMRVSVLPTNEGEKCVIRILDFQKGLSGLDGLGFTPKNFAKIQKMLSVPNGIILVTGATGSGKSTTTYSMLSALNKEETNIITIEDPIEMNIEGINQVQVNSEIGMTFATVLRSILRQDPNVILVGEMRDEETAQIAVRAAITGHLVLSTIHTNNALATLERLFDMGVERYMVATSMVGIISQRLARTLCDKCKKLRPTTKYERYMFARVLHKKVKEIYEPVGCSNCHGGFKGRIAIQEVLYISEHLRDMIADENIDKERLKVDVYGNGETTTLLQDALQKVIMGHTTFQEVYRVVDIDVDLDNAIKTDMGYHEETDDKVVDMEEDLDWMYFDGVFDDELELIDIDKEDESDLPTIDTSIINVAEFEWQFKKELDPSDPEFVKFFIIEDKKIMDEDISMKEQKYKLFNQFIKQYELKMDQDRKNKLFNNFLSQYDMKLSKSKKDELFNNFLSQYDTKLSKSKKDELFNNFLSQYDMKLSKSKKDELFNNFLSQYDMKLSKSKKDELFNNFLVQYDIKLGSDKKLNKQKTNELFKQFILEYEAKLRESILAQKDLLDTYDNNLIDEFGLTENSPLPIDKSSDEEAQNYDDIVLYENNTLDNLIDNYVNLPTKEERKSNILDLTNVKFNYKEILELIDAYSDGGPSIQDVVDDTIGEIID